MHKKIIGVTQAVSAQQAGQPYAQHVLFNSQGLGRQINPVVQLGYVPAQAGVAGTGAPQAMRGCEAVTLVLQGSLQLRDSTGHTQLLQAGDAQWLTAGSGVLQQAIVPNDATLELVQLLVNLPAQYKMTPPHHQQMVAAPVTALPDAAGSIQVLAGEYAGQLGPAETVAPLQLWTLQLHQGASTTFQLPAKWYGVLLVLSGKVDVNHWPHAVGERQLVVFGPFGYEVALHAHADSRLLLVSAEPLDETVAGQGALVLNTPEELEQTLQEVAAGRLGTL